MLALLNVVPFFSENDVLKPEFLPEAEIYKKISV
jgi:hypothetical protein